MIEGNSSMLLHSVALVGLRFGFLHLLRFSAYCAGLWQMGIDVC